MTRNSKYFWVALLVLGLVSSISFIGSSWITHNRKVEWASNYARGWVRYVNITNTEVLKEPDGTFYLHIEDSENPYNISVWTIRPNHPSYDNLETMAKRATSGAFVYMLFEFSDPESLPATEPESYIRAKNGGFVPKRK